MQNRWEQPISPTHGSGEIFPVNTYNTQNIGIWTSTLKKDIGKHKHSEVKGFLNIFHEAEIHAIP